jgi:uncharacterized repeat protein (TIGR03837 family)
VIEAFGCDLPEAWIARMATMARPPVWINLEYLSAESYVERAHGLASPQSVGPGAGLTKWFYYPGFTQGTGGLLLNTQALVQSTPSTTQDTSLALAPGDRLVSMFVYEHAQLSGLLDALDHEPTTVVAFQGAPLRALRAHFDGDRRGRHLRLRPLPWLSQADFDAVLRRCDLNVVRGEDSLVSAIAAGKPFVWNIYAQPDGVHAQKLWALLDRIRLACPTHPDQASEPAAWTAMKDLWLDLNRLSETRAHAPLTNARLDGWRRWQTPWLTGLQARPDLALGLRRFVQQRLGKPSPS